MWITIDRAQRRNSLTVATVNSIRNSIRDASDVRAIVITGQPPTFCSGGDLPELADAAAQGAASVLEVIYDAFHELVRAVSNAPVPVIAAVNGAALGAGFDLAMVCDLRLASPDARFSSSWLGAGLVPGMGGAFILPRIIGSTRAAEALLLGRSIDAQQALSWGLVNEVAVDVELTVLADRWVSAIAEQPARAVHRTKQSLRRGIDAGMATELATVGAVQSTLLTAADFDAAVARFRARSLRR
jgi:2-(1,2-epoxy-1,2-dihydrophenyl)acetyl-CoA isomerase